MTEQRVRAWHLPSTKGRCNRARRRKQQGRGATLTRGLDVVEAEVKALDARRLAPPRAAPPVSFLPLGPLCVAKCCASGAAGDMQAAAARPGWASTQGAAVTVASSSARWPPAARLTAAADRPAAAFRPSPRMGTATWEAAAARNLSGPATLQAGARGAVS